jgi:drug/metabolite transporter (DMT)-like permease
LGPNVKQRAWPVRPATELIATDLRALKEGLIDTANGTIHVSVPTARDAQGLADGEDGRRSPEGGAKSRRQAQGLLLALGLVWGSNWAVTKIGLGYIPPFTYGALRVLTGLGALVTLLAVRGSLRLPPRADLTVVLSVGLGQVAAAIAIMNLALQVVPAGRSSVLVYTMPLWVAVIQAIVLRRGLDNRHAIGLALGLIGIAALVNPGAINWRNPGQLTGSIALVASAVIWAATTIQLRHHGWTGTPLELQPWELLVALVPLALLAVVLDRNEQVQWGIPAVAALAFSGPLATGFGYWASQSISRSLTPIETTVGFLAVPVVGLLAGTLVLGEPMGLIDFAGFALTILAIAFVSLSPGSTEV